MREVFWGDGQPAAMASATIVSVSDEWVRYGHGRNDRFRNPRIAGGFVINSSELRGVNFSMEPLNGSSAQRVGVLSLSRVAPPHIGNVGPLGSSQVLRLAPCTLG